MTLEVVGASKIRNQDVGDWDEEGNIKIARLGDYKMETCLAVHEIVEWTLCKSLGITDEVVTNFDADHLTFIGHEHHESGDCPLSPYSVPHKTATMVERLVAFFLGVSWEDYGKVIDSF